MSNYISEPKVLTTNRLTSADIVAKYYLEQVQITDTEAKGLFEYDTIDEAEIAMRSVMRDSIINPNMNEVRCKVIDNNGAQQMCDFWEKEEPQEPPVGKHYLSQIQYKPDNTSVKALFSYESLEEALSAYDAVIASTMSNPEYNRLMAMVEDRQGNELYRRYWERG